MHHLGVVLSLALLAGCRGCRDEEGPPPAGPAGYAHAAVIDSAAQGIGGPLAQAVGGDVLLENDLVRVVLQKPGRAIALDPYGGNIIDADVVRADADPSDRFGEVGLFVNGAFTMAPETMEIVDDGSDGRAVVRFTGPAARSGYIDAGVGIEQIVGLDFPIDTWDVPDWRLTLTYTLEADSPFVRVDALVENTDDREWPVAPAWLSHVGLSETYYPDLGGFRTLPLASVGALLAPTDGVAYAFAPLPYAPGAHGFATMAGGAIVVDGAGVLDLLDWPAAASAVLSPGDSFAFDAAFVVGEDLSQVMGTLRALGEDPPATATISGTLTVEGSDEPVPDAGIVARDGSTVVSGTVTAGDGSYSLVVPAGPVDLVWARDGWPYAGGGDEPEPLSVDASADTVQDLELPPTGALSVTVRDGSGGPLPARLLVMGLDPSPPVSAFDATNTDPLPPGFAAVADVDAGGAVLMDLEPGDYDVVVTRGMEYDAAVESITVSAGAVAEVAVTLHRVLDTTGMLNGDFHNHASRGPDLVLTDEERVANTAAEGLEVLVVSNHAYVTDLAQAVDVLAMEGWVATIPSQEITTFDYGHFGVFPLEIVEESPNGGAFDWEGRSPVDIFEWANDLDQDVVVQINHPRHVPTPVDSQNYFSVLDLSYDESGWYRGPEAYDPTGIDPDEMFGPDFTAMELMTWLNVQGLSDWFNLMSSGWVFCATANSDTHTTRVESSGWPRNFVQVSTDDPGAMDTDEFVAAVNGLKLSGSFGPLVTIEAATEDGSSSAGMGEVLDGQGQPVVVAVRVQAAPWVAVDTLDLWVDGELAASERLELQSVAGAEGGTRLEQTVEVTIDVPADAWVAPVVYGSGSLFPYVPYNTSDPTSLTLEALRAGEVDEPATPFGFANPVYVDADGDGLITPSYHVYPADYDDWRFEDRLAPY